ncbi:MAG TPA: hypothetical protein VJW76_05810 [Verrucomicrobiae bacterium]|nr:hypothetical protein [Verrucomicrobiae bacterium]
MNQRSYLFIGAIGAALTGFLIGRFGFVPLLELAFPAYVRKLGTLSPTDVAAAAGSFSVAFGFLAALFPLSAMVTERFAAQGRYGQALGKSLLMGLLLVGLGLFYQHQHLASMERLAVKMPGMFGSTGPDASLGANPLTRVVWFAVICLLVFGPLDLWIARLQKQRRAEKVETPPV